MKEQPVQTLRMAQPALDRAQTANQPDTPSLGDPESPPQGARRPVAAAPVQSSTFDRYLVMEVLGRGGMGVVYRALDRALGREVALKTLAGSREATPAMRERQLREARAVARLEHPGIVQLYDCFEEQGRLYLAMRVVRGPTLSSLLADGPLAPDEAARIVAEVARTLAFAHAQGTVHRDVKPANIVLEQGRPVLMDFGLALSSDSGDQRLTAEGQIMGTPAYMAPEQLMGGLSAVGPASDQYALGVTLYELLAGTPPFTAATRAELFALVAAGRPPPLPEAVPRDLSKICLRAIARAPHRRFKDLTELANALDRWRAGARPIALWDEAAGMLDDALRRGRTLALIALGAAALLGGERGAEHLWQLRQRDARWERAEGRRSAMEARATALRERGDDLSAEELFEAYTSLPENQETPALSAAWLDAGARLVAAGDDTGAISALTVAHGVAPTTEGQVAALVALARVFRERHQWDGLRGVMGALDRRGYRGAELADLRRDLALTEHDLEGASAAGAHDPALAPLLTLLERAVVTARRATAMALWDLDGDGVEEIGLIQHDQPTLAVAARGDPSLPIQREILLEQGKSNTYVIFPVRGLDLPEPLAETRVEGGCAMVSPEGPGLTRRVTWPCVNAGALAAGDLDGDGRAEVYLANDRVLLRLDPKTLAPPVPVDATINRANSEVHTLNVVDLDRDGSSELVVGSGAWGAYDLRIMAQQGDALPLVARAQLGEIWGAGVVNTPDETWIAAAQTHQATGLLSRQIFGDSTPHGAPWGVYLYAWQGGDLLPRGFLPWPTPPKRSTSDDLRGATPVGDILLVGDVDGDGVNEIALGVLGSWTIVYRMRPDRTWASMTLDGMFPLGFTDVDGDGDDELLARSNDRGGVVVLGAGTDALPRLEQPALTRAAPPEGIDPDLVSIWERAEDIVEFGVLDVAADRFEALARLGVGTPVEGRALMRAAEVLGPTGARARARAVALYTRAADLSDTAAAALEAGAALCLEDARLEAALDLMRRRLALPDPPPGLEARARSLQERVEQPLSRVDFRQGLDPAWRVDDPVGLTLEGGGLRVHAQGDRRALHLPVTWRGGHTRLQISLDMIHQDWSGRLSFSVARVGEVSQSNLTFMRNGGGGVYYATMVCDQLPAATGLSFIGGLVNTLTWEYSPEDRRASCVLTVDGREEARVSYVVPERVFPEGPLDLAISVTGEGAATDAIVRDLAFSGFDLRPEPEVPAELAAGLLARGQPAAALAALGADRPSAPLASVIALSRLGRVEEADAALVQALRAGALSAADRRAVLVAGPARLGAALRTALGPGWCAAFDDTYGLVAQMHAEDPATVATLLSGLEGVERRGACGADTGLQAELLVLRAGALRRSGRPAEARQDAERALALYQRGREPDPRRSAAERERALDLMAEGDAEAAMASILAALRGAPAPEVSADVLAHNPDLATLRSSPSWAEIEAARGGVGRAVDPK